VERGFLLRHRIGLLCVEAQTFVTVSMNPSPALPLREPR
jgi:hypothetical protein